MFYVLPKCPTRYEKEQTTMEYIDESKELTDEIMAHAEAGVKSPALVIYSTMLKIAKDPERLAERVLSAQEDCRHYAKQIMLCSFRRDIEGTYLALQEQVTSTMDLVSMTLVQDEHISDYARFLSAQLKLLGDAAKIGSETFLKEMPMCFLGAMCEIFGDVVSSEVHPDAQRIYDNEMRIGKEVLATVMAEITPAVEGAN
jgi:hypothetical protein